MNADTRRPPTRFDNYMTKVIELTRTLPPGTRADVDVFHDPWCDSTNGRGFCNCDPTVKLREYTQ